jgi:hypothetical protein
MKIRDYLYTLAVLICGTAISSAGLLINPYRFGPSAPSYLVNQNFEATGYDNGESWTEDLGTGGTVDEDYAISPLVGSQSLLLSEATGDVSTKITIPGGPHADLWGYTQLQVVSHPNDGVAGRQLIRFGNGSPLLGGVLIDVAGGTSFKLRAHNGDSPGTPSTDSFTSGVVHIWWHASTITDTCEVWWSDTSTRSATGGTKYSTFTSSISTEYVELWILCDYPAAQFKFDKVLVSTSEIGDAP